jgi:serine/threonine protein kinase
LARDTLAADAPAALRRLGPDRDQPQVRQLWARLQGVLHPQVPRVGAAISEGEELWLVREWQAGRTYQQLLAARQDRQLVFGAGEVLLLLRQLLPVLAALHSQDLIHGDLTPANVLRRDSDGLPVLLDFGLLRGPEGGVLGATPGYAPPDLLRGEPPQPWMDLHALGVMALVLLSGDGPERLLQPQSMEWRWPSALDGEPALRQQLERLLSRDPGQRLATAARALTAFQALPMPDSTGPVPRADRTVVLVPSSPPPPPSRPAPCGAHPLSLSHPRRWELSTWRARSGLDRRTPTGLFRARVANYSSKCRVTGVAEPSLLRASHIKPWSKCESNEERLDGANGLLLSPHVDLLFDKGLLTFRPTGQLEISEVLPKYVVEAWNITRAIDSTPFKPRQAEYLKFHNDVVYPLGKERWNRG